jgi:hypothetical protein
MNSADDPSDSDQPVGHVMRCLGLWLVCGLLLVAPGCGSSGKRASVENDRLRADNLQLQREIEQLHGTVKAKADQLQALESSTTPPADPGAQIPQVTFVKFGRYCTAIDENGDEHDDLIRLYVITLDQSKRYIPVAGNVVAQVDHLVPGKDPVKLATRTFDAKAFDAAYRSNITGIHYTLDIPLPKGDAIKDVTQVTVSLLLTDLQHGTTFNEQIVLPIKP